MKRPHFIKHRKDVEPTEQVRPPAMDEMFGYVGEFASEANISHLRIAHMRLPPGIRGYPPLAVRDVEIFAFVLEGTPDLWIDGHLHRLKPGDGICFNTHTGIAHSLLNNSDKDARILIVSEPIKLMSKGVHPVDPAANENLKKMGMFWADAPKRKLGPHDGLTDAKRGASSPKGSRKTKLPAFVMHWRDILDKESATYPNSDELHGIDALFGRRARYSRIGVHVELLKPGRRTSWPHAERDEDEFVYVVSGQADAWNDGYITPLGEGDFIGWEGGTGITHVIMNNSDEDAMLIVGGEAGRARNQFWYPFHPKRNKEIGALYWADHPVPKLGPHDGMPDALRAKRKTKRNTRKRK
jgi:uncharacterized cupin superfamily protein